MKENMTSISENLYTDKLDNSFNKYNNTYHKTTKMKLTDFKSSDKDPKFKVNGIYSHKRLKSKLVRKSFSY